MSLKCEWTAAESFSVLEGINFSQLGKNLVRPMAKKAIKWRDFHLSILSIFFAHGTLKFISLQLYWLSTDDSFHVRQFPRSRPALYTTSTKGLFKASCLRFSICFLKNWKLYDRKEHSNLNVTVAKSSRKWKLEKKIPTLNETKLVSLVRGLEQLNRCRFRFKTHFVYYNLSLKAIMKVQIQVYGSQRCQKCSAC